MPTKSVQVPIINLAKESGSEKLHVKGLEDLVVRLRQRLLHIEALQADQKMERKLLVEEVSKRRVNAEIDGQFYKTCLVESRDEDPARVTYMNKFSKIDSQHEPVLKQCLGKLFDQLYEVKHVVALKENIDYAYIKQLLGDKLDALFDVKSHIEHRPSFMERRFVLRPTLNNKTNKLIDELASQTQAEPSVYLK